MWNVGTSDPNSSTQGHLRVVSLARGLWKRNDLCPMPAAEQIVNRYDVGRILICKHEPDAIWMFAND